MTSTSMPAAPKISEGTSVLVDYASPGGSTVTHVRGSVVLAALSALKAAGLYDQYVSNLEPRHREPLLGSLAMSWVPLELAMAHAAAGDALGLSERASLENGEQIANQVGESTLSILWRTARTMGVDAGWWLLKQTDRIWPRIYQGGGCTVLQTGPKDAVLEAHGIPMMTSRFYRACHQGFLLGACGLFSKAAFVRPVRAREPHPHRVALALSWV